MSTERTVLVLLLVVAVAAVGGFFFMKAEAVSGQADQARLAALEAARAAEEAARREGGEGGEVGATVLDANLQARLAELGFPRGFVPGPDRAVLLGRAMGRAAVPAGAQTMEGVPFEPLGGAKIALHRIGDDGIADPSVETEAAARPDGWFAVTVDRKWGRKVVVSAEGYQPAEREVTRMALTGVSDLGEVSLERLASVTIVVTTGRADLGEPVSPVKGMSVLAHAGDEESPLGRGVTDDEGKLALEGLPTQTLTFAGLLDPYAAFEESTRVMRDGQVVEVNVDAVGAVRIQVTTAGGAPVDAFKAALALQYPSYAPFQPKFVDLEPDENGWALIEKVKTGKWDVYATAAGWALGTSEGIVVEAGQTTEVKIALPHGFPVRGRVVAKGSDKPVGGAIVYSEKDLVPWSVSTHTRDQFRDGAARAARCDADGYFELKDLTAGSHKLTAMHPEFASHALQAVKVGKDGDTPEVKISLPLGGTLSGHVYDTAGHPSSGANVLVIYFQDMRNNKKKIPLMSATDAKGAYRIEHVAAGQGGVIMTPAVPVDGQAPYEMKMATFKNGVHVKLNFGKPMEGATVRGRVLTPEGGIVTGMTVMLISAVNITDGDIPEFHQAAADGNGEYEIKGVPGGRYQVALAKSLKGSDFASGEVMEVPESGLVEKDVIVRGGAVRGRIVSAAGGGAPRNGEVTLLDAAGQFRGHLMVEGDGSYEFPVVQPGTYVAVARADDHVIGTQEGITVLDGQDTEVAEIRLQPGGRIVGHVKDAEGNPIEGAQITFATPSGETQPAWAYLSASDGAFAAESVPVGTYAISASKSGLTFPGSQVTVTQGGTTTTTIQAQ